MVSPHLAALEVSYSSRFKLLLSPLSCTRAGTIAFLWILQPLQKIAGNVAITKNIIQK